MIALLWWQWLLAGVGVYILGVVLFSVLVFIIAIPIFWKAWHQADKNTNNFYRR